MGKLSQISLLMLAVVGLEAREVLQGWEVFCEACAVLCMHCSRSAGSLQSLPPPLLGNGL